MRADVSKVTRPARINVERHGEGIMPPRRVGAEQFRQRCSRIVRDDFIDSTVDKTLRESRTADVDRPALTGDHFSCVRTAGDHLADQRVVAKFRALARIRERPSKRPARRTWDGGSQARLMSCHRQRFSLVL